MSVDTKMSLRTSLCLANPSALHGARWKRLDTRQALRPVVCLPNPSRMQAARWIVTENRELLITPSSQRHALRQSVKRFVR